MTHEFWKPFLLSNQAIFKSCKLPPVLYKKEEVIKTHNVIRLKGKNLVTVEPVNWDEKIIICWLLESGTCVAQRGFDMAWVEEGTSGGSDHTLTTCIAGPSACLVVHFCTVSHILTVPIFHLMNILLMQKANKVN